MQKIECENRKFVPQTSMFRIHSLRDPEAIPIARSDAVLYLSDAIQKQAEKDVLKPV
jgi:hypothetical protein